MLSQGTTASINTRNWHLPWKRTQVSGKSDHHPKNNTTPLYRGNVRSRIFHRPGCRYFNCTDCAIEFHSREDALEAGYIPCSKCSP
ncbi:MAG: hypothetical protein DRG59_02375 [Deltaproteobacteria bacterium]|nr:MAG: hypothetical protein DRG83_01495 [Deltaproteobacteria bacterium]RLB09446.1 MAG: hypothetical protein DRG59_02375 [Deltaproteobacteria bacterium]